MEYRQHVPRNPDRNMIEPDRVELLVGDMRDVTVDGLGLPTDYGDPYPFGRLVEPHKPTVSRVLLGTVGAIVLAVVVVVGLLQAFAR